MAEPKVGSQIPTRSIVKPYKKTELYKKHGYKKIAKAIADGIVPVK